MRHANLRLRRMELGMTLQQVAAQTGLPVWVVLQTEVGKLRHRTLRRFRARLAAYLLLPITSSGGMRRQPSGGVTGEHTTLQRT